MPKEENTMGKDNTAKMIPPSRVELADQDLNKVSGGAIGELGVFTGRCDRCGAPLEFVKDAALEKEGIYDVYTCPNGCYPDGINVFR